MKRILSLLVLSVIVKFGFGQITTYPYIENFDAYGVCTPYAFNTACAVGGGWTNAAAATANWLVADGASGASTSSLTGPGLGTSTRAVDHTLGTTAGNFVFVETSGSGSNKVAILESPVFDLSSLAHPVISYWYHMYGATMGDVFLEASTNGGTTWVIIDSIIGPQQTGYANADPWRNRTVDLCAYAGQTAVEFRFRGQTGTSFTSDMSLDDIEVFNQPDDLVMSQIISPTGDSCGNTASTPITFEYTFSACTPTTNIPVWYSVNGGPLVRDTIPGPIAPSSTNNFTFSQTANFSGVNTYSLTIVANWSGDTDPLNDTLSITFNTVFSPDPPMVMNDSACAPDSVTLSATLVNGDTIIWKDSSGFVVGYGPTFTTPVLNNTTAYFASAATGSGGLGPLDSIPQPPYSNTFSAALTRGYWFTAPAAATLTGVRVPTDVGTQPSSIQIVRFAGPPIPFPGPGNNFTTLYLGQNVPGTGIIPVNIQVNPGDVIGVLGARGGAGGMNNSYAAGNNLASTFAGNPITLQRLIYQGNLSTAVPVNGDLMSETPGGSVTRVELYYRTGGVSSGCESPGVPVLGVMFEPGSVNLGPDTFLCAGDTILLSPGNIPGATYSWFTSSGTGSGTTAPSLPVWQSDTIIVSVTPPVGGCTIVDTVIVTVGNPIQFSLDSINTLACYGDSNAAIYTSNGGGNTIVDGVPSVCGPSNPAVANCSPATPFILGTGLGTNNVNTPFYSTWEDQRMQVLFLASELQAIGMTGGQIVDIGFDVVTHTGTDPMTLTISMGCTGVTQITGFQAGLTQVFNATNYIPPAGGFTTHTFQTPYEWDGTSNLIVEICMDKLDWGGTNSMRFTPGPPNTVYLEYQDGAANCATPYNITRNNGDRPNTRFGFCNAGLDTIPLSVLWNTGDTTDNVTGLSAGTYSVVITDALGCTRDSSNIVIGQPDSLDIQLDTIINNACGDTIGGEIQISVIGGTPPFTYAWSNGDVSQDIDSLSSGNYQVTVTDSNGCTKVSTVWAVTEPAGGTVTVDSVVDVNCFGDSTGAIFVTLTGGTPPFNYQWSNGASTIDLIGVPAGSYDLTITDSLACSVFTPVTTINENPVIIITVDTVVNTFCFGDSSAEIQISVNGGVPPYSYSWSNGMTSKDIDSIPSGTYAVTVTDSLGCVKVESNIAVLDAPSILFSIDSIADVACFGDSTGAIFTSTSGGTPMTGSGSTVPYMYSWNNLLPVEDPTGVPAGTYRVTVTDALGCTFDTSGIVVSQPPFFAAVIDSIQQNQCAGDTIGMIYTSIVGGAGPFNFAWSNGDTTEDIGPLAAGDYGLTVTDNNGCITTLEGQDSIVTIIDPGPIQFQFDSIFNPLCFDDSTGAIFTTVLSQGIVDSVPNPSYDRTYTAQQTRGYWFTAPVNMTITGLKVPTDVGTLPQSVQLVRFVGPPIPFPGPGNAFTTLYLGQNIASTGVLPVNVQVNAGDVIGVIGGRGNAGNMNNSYAAINNAPSFIDGNPVTLQRLVYQANLSTTAGAVAGDLMSEAPAGVVSRVEMYYQTGSAAPSSSYSYLWNTGDTTANLVNVPAGTYNITVSDTFGCSLDTFVTLTQPSKLRVQIDSFQNVRCNNDSNGLIAITMVGGTQSGSGTTITWSTGDTTSTISGLAPGSYTLNAVDDNGCTFDTTFVITQPNPLQFNIDSVIDNNCFADTFGAIYVTPTGGTMPYNYMWSNRDTSQDLVNVRSGPFTLMLSDANGCMYQASDTVESPPEFTITLDSIIHVDCNGASTGGLVVTVNGGVPSYSYSWSNGDSTANLSGAPAGSYNLTVTDDNGCESIRTNMVITEPQVALSAVVDSIVNATCATGSNDGAIYLTAFGGTPPYTYAWTGNLPPVDDPIGINAGTYDLTITDFNGCTFTLNSIVVNFDVAPINVDLGVDTTVCDSLVLDAGAFPGATYLWSTGARSRTIKVSATGSYWVEVTDACGPVIDAIQVTVNRTPQAAFGYWGLNNTISFQNQTLNDAGSTYLWDFGDGNSSSLSDPTHLYTSGGQFTANLTVSNSCGTTSYQDTVYVVLLSLEDLFADENFNVYPNPTDQFINIELTGEFEEDLNIELYDPLGRLVQRDEVEGIFGFHRHQFDVSSLATGTYLVRVTDGSSDLVQQIVVH